MRVLLFRWLAQTTKLHGRCRHVIHEQLPTAGCTYLVVGFQTSSLALSSSAEGLTAITCQMSRLQMPRAHTTAPGRDPHIRRGVYAGTLRVPRLGTKSSPLGKKTQLGPGSIQGSLWPISLTRKYIKNTCERLIIQFVHPVKNGIYLRRITQFAKLSIIYLIS